MAVMRSEECDRMECDICTEPWSCECGCHEETE